MRTLYYTFSFAALASAQYEITDLLDSSKHAPPPPRPEAGGLLTQQTGPQHLLVHKKAAQPVNSAAQAMMKTLLGGQTLKAGDSAAVSQESMAVVSGLIEAFMHKVKLQPGEKSCLENNIRVAGGDITGAVGDVVEAVKTLIAGKGTVQKNQAGGFISAGLDSAMKITSLVSSSMQLIKHCVHGDALALLNMTAHHMINGTYLEKRFIVNGVDIARSLADTIVAFEGHDFHRLGSDLGKALRKILLSTAQKQGHLPEGMPEQKIIQEATDGLMKGFFVQGSSMTVTDALHPDIDINVDLHRCIAGNSGLFKELWLAAWNLIAQLSVNAQQHELSKMFWSKRGGQPKWEGELMVALMEFPSALANCGLDPNIQTMLNEAIQSLGSVRVQVSLPHARFGMNTEADQMAKAVEAWTNWNFEAFGFELGKLLRELVMLAFPQKYEVDARGKLSLASERAVVTTKKSIASDLCNMLMIGAGSLTMIVLFARRVVVQRRHVHEHLATDLEECTEHDVDVQ